MSYDIQQSTTQAPLLFLMVQSSDHITGLTGASPTVTISKDGGSFASPSGSVTEIANGWYKCAGNATDTNTLGPLALHATAASGDPCDIVVANIVAYNPQDAVRAGLTALPNANAEAAGGLYTRGTGAGQIKQTNNGEIDSNSTHINNVATTSVTTISAILGQAQALVFNANNFLKVSLNDILGTTLTETAGQLAAGFKKWFNVATPTSTMNEITLVDTVTTNTDMITQANIRTAVGLASANLDTQLSSIKTDTGTTIPGLIAALNNISSANVKTQVVAALSTDTYAEPAQGAPTSTIDLATKISFLYKALINKYTQTATTFSLYNAAAAVVDQKSTCSDDGTTATRGKIVTGP